MKYYLRLIEWTSFSQEEEEESGSQASMHTVYIFGDSHARDQATHLNASLNRTFNIKSTCCPGWPLNEVVEKAIDRLNEFVNLSAKDFIVFVGGSNDTSKIHQKKLFHLYSRLFAALTNTNIIVCETPFRFDEVEKNIEIAETNNMVAQMCNVSSNARFLPMINSMQRHHFTDHGLHMRHSGKRVLSRLISNCIEQILLEQSVSSLRTDQK